MSLREVTNLVSNGKPSNSRLNPKAIIKSMRKKLISRIGAIFLASRMYATIFVDRGCSAGSIIINIDNVSAVFEFLSMNHVDEKRRTPF